MGKNYFVIWCAFVVGSVLSIRVHNEGVKTKQYHTNPQISEALRNSRHQSSYTVSGSQTMSNEYNSGFSNPAHQRSDTTTAYQGSTRVYQTNQGNIDSQAHTPYAYVGENDVASYLTECPPNATGQFAYLYDCRRFLNCWKGRGYIQSCAPGTVFNPDTLECDNPKKVVCLGLGSGTKDETSARYTQDHSASSRMPGTIFTTKTTTTTTTSGDIKCTTGYSGMQPHPIDCTKFLNCANGETHIQDCGPGTYFNPSMKVCDTAQNVECRTRGRLVQDPRTTIFTSRTKKVKCSPGASGIEPHPYDCTKFLNCAHGITHIQSCGPGTVFNPQISVCDYPYNVDCGSRTVGDDSSTTFKVRIPIGNIQQSQTKPTSHSAHVHEYEDRQYTVDIEGGSDTQKPVKPFGQSSQGFGQSSQGFKQASRGTTQSSRGYGQTSQGFGQTSQGSGQTSQGFGQTSQGFGQTSQGFGQTSQGFGQTSQGTLNTEQQSTDSSYQHQHTHQHGHGHNHRFHDHQHQHGHFHGHRFPSSQQYNWTGVSTADPSSSRHYNWTRTITTYPTETRNYNWTWTQTHPSEVNPTGRPQYPTAQTSTQSWPHQTTQNRPVNTQGTTFGTDNFGYSEDTQRQERPDWINRPSTSTSGSSTTWSGSVNRYPPSSSSTSYHIEQATVQRYPQSNSKNVSDTESSSTTTTIYYAQPVEDSDELFDNISGGDVPPKTDINNGKDRISTAYSQSHFDPNGGVKQPLSPRSFKDFPLNTPADSFSEPSIRHSIIYRINNTLFDESPRSHDSPVPIPSAHLLPPYPSSGTKKPLFSSDSAEDDTLRPYNFSVSVPSVQLLPPFPPSSNEEPGFSQTKEDDSPVPIPSAHLLPPYLSSSTKKPLFSSDSAEDDTLRPYNFSVSVPSVQLLPPFPPSSNEDPGISQTKEYDSLTPKDDSPKPYDSPVFVPSVHLLPPFPPPSTKKPRFLPSSVDDSVSLTSNINTVRINKTSTDYDSNLYGGLLPPHPSINQAPPVSAPPVYMLPPYPPLYTEEDVNSVPLKNFSSESARDSFSSSSTRTNVYIRPNTSDYDSNLYGGLLPPLPTSNTENIESHSVFASELPKTPSNPKPNVHTYTIYPSLKNYTFGVSTTNFSSPIYSPSYSSISHSRNWSTHIKSDASSPEILPPTDPWVHSVNKSIVKNPMDSASLPVVFDRETKQFPKVIPLSTQPPSTSPPSTVPPYSPIFNREYYKQTATLDTPELNVDEMSQLPISEAVKALLRPYINRSGTVTGDDVQKAESFIMKIEKAKTDYDFKKEPREDELKNEDTKKNEHRKLEKEVELIFTGEQESLSQGTARDNRNHSRPHYGHPHSHWHNNPESHSREFHQSHPHLRNPFASNANTPPPIRPSPPPDSETISAPDLHASGTNYPATTPTYNFGRKYDREPVDDGQTTISFDQTVSETTSNEGNFDCRNGKWVKDFEVCNGVNNCGNRMDENYCDHLGYEVRLSNEEGSKHMGRVEVKILGKWGYVCDDKFGLRDADVLCRELGFPLGASEVRANSYYPPHVEMIGPNGDVLFVMDEIDCKGNESSLKECDFKGWGVHDCSADEVVGVVCKIPVMKCPNDFWLCSTSKECIPPAFVCDNVPDCADKSDESDLICNSVIEYRLADGRSKTEGRVEVKYQGIWGTVCDDDFTKTEAQVVCKTLGFYGHAQVLKNTFGPGIGPIWLDQVSCLGNETSLDKCSHWSWAEHNCNHTEDVSIRCSTTAEQENPSGVKGVKGVRGVASSVPPPISGEVELYPYLLERSSKILKEHHNCGIINTNVTDEFEKSEEMMQRVVQGSKAKRGHHPWQATIRTRGRSGKSNHWCGAVLISERHLLTAAHCLAGYGKGAYFVRLGDHYGNIAESSEIDVYIENWYIHEQFRKGTHMNNDIAILILKRPVRFNDYIHPICLPSKGAKYEEGRECVISGWGSIQSGISTPTNQLRAAKIPIISHEVCKQPHVYGNAITDGMFCAGYLDESVDACDGDSGGPLVCHDNGVETLFGIISWGQHCGYQNRPGVYVKVARYIDWIYEKLGILPEAIGDIR